MTYRSALVLAASVLISADAVVMHAHVHGVAMRAPTRPRAASMTMNFMAKLLEEVDRFADDAMGRRLGNGASFYGKRKSSFYGEDDSNRKADPDVFSEEEDWRGPGGGSYFVLSKECDEQGRPLGFLTRKEAREQKLADEAAARDSTETLAQFAEAANRDDGDRISE